MGFKPSKADSGIWMWEKDGYYEYVAVYVDDLLITSRDPQVIIDWLEKKNLFKLKGTGPISFHLGCNFFQDNDGTLYIGPKSYINRMAALYKTMFGQKPKPIYLLPLVPNDHPEYDTSDLLDNDGIK